MTRHLNRWNPWPRADWVKTSVRGVLGNEVYVGTPSGVNSLRDLPAVRYENAWPAIITRSASIG